MQKKVRRVVKNFDKLFAFAIFAVLKIFHMHQRTLEQLKEGVKIVKNGNMNVGNDSINGFSLPQKDGTYILTVSNGGTEFTIKPR